MGGRGRLRYPNLSLAARMATLLRAASALYAAQYRPIFLLFKPNGEHFLNIKRIQWLAGATPGGESEALYQRPWTGTDFGAAATACPRESGGPRSGTHP